MLAEDLERVVLAGQLAELERLPGESLSPATRSPSSTAHAATPTCATQLSVG